MLVTIMICFLFVISAFLIGYSLNSSVGFKSAIEASSVALALVGVYVAHLLSKNRERVKEYENVYSLLNGICVVSKKIADIVEASKKEYKKGEYISAPLPSIEIITVCSEELLNTYKKDVDSLEAKRLFDPDSVIAVLNFKLHFQLFVHQVLVYMNFYNKMNKNMKDSLEYYSAQIKYQILAGEIEEAKENRHNHDSLLVSHFNSHCDSILTQYQLLVENKNQVGLGLRNAKKSL